MKEIQKINALNKSISYDEHGSIPLHVPFKEIQAKDITFYFNLDTRVGEKTCQQTCSHCFFISEKEARNRSIDLHEALKITKSLKEKGYSVYPRSADSFTDNGKFLELFSNSNVRNYCSGEQKSSTETMEKGEIWTSGAVLLKNNWYNLLKRGLKNNFGTISITFHALLNEDLSLQPKEHYPFKGVFYGEDTEKVIARIKQFNQEQENCYNLAFGITIGKHNNSKKDLINYIHYFNRVGAHKVRFNCFHDYSRKHPHLELSTAEIAQFYKDIKWIHTNIYMNYELGLSEDFGNQGIRIMGFPSNIGTCQAGRQLFAIVPEKREILRKNKNLVIDKIGSIAGCVDAFKPIMGNLICITDINNGHEDYDVEFFYDVIDEVTQKRINNVYKNGCFGPELHKEYKRNYNIENISISSLNVKSDKEKGNNLCF